MSGSDSDSDKKTGLKKEDKYSKEQSIILTKLNNILGISDTNNKFYLCDMNDSVQKQIEGLLDDVKRYYKCGRSRLCNVGDVKRIFLAIIKIIYKAANINLYRIQQTVERNGKKINSGVYIVGIGA
jgi:hypothetical protein